MSDKNQLKQAKTTKEKERKKGQSNNINFPQIKTGKGAVHGGGGRLCCSFYTVVLLDSLAVLCVFLIKFVF